MALPAGSQAHSFLFGTEVPDTHIIKLLNEDFCSTSNPFEKALSVREPCAGTGSERGALTLVNRPSGGPVDARLLFLFCSQSAEETFPGSRKGFS